MRHGLLLLLAFAPAAVGQGTTYQAKITLEGGVSLPITPLVTPVREGKLSWLCRINNIFGNGNVNYAVVSNDPSSPREPGAAVPDDCLVDIRLSGYQLTRVTLHEGLVVVLKRGGTGEGSEVSLSSLSAPKDAKAAYAKGVDAASKQKWAKAQPYLEQAVQLYPEYAAAWTELGDVRKAQSNSQGAREAYERALKADPKYTRGYLQAARLALDEGRFEDGLKLSESAIALSPTEFPEAYFYNAVANFNLKRLDAAQKSAEKTIELDPNHRLPRAEQLLGYILAAKGQKAAALEHLHNYIRLSPVASDTVETLQLIRQLE